MTAPLQASDIVFTRYPASRGIGWLRESWAMFGRARPAWLVLVALYYLILLMANWLLGAIHPALGQAVPMLFKPVFAVGFLAAAWAQERGRAPHPRDLFRGFRSNVAALLGCGLAMILGLVAAVAVASIVSENRLMEIVSGAQAPSDELLRDPRLQLGLVAGALVALPVTLALWYAPALIVFQDANARPALGASLRAALANWRPMLVYALAVFVFGAILPVAALQLFFAIVPSGIATVVGQVLLAIWGIMLAATLHVSDYVSYRDIFHAGETLAPLGPGSGHDSA